MSKIVIAGASGFVGKRLIETLKESHELVALSRGKQREDGIEWRSCDLFSLKETEAALEGAEVGIYLVHSMLPSARLTQGAFQDFDLISADNFARAAKKVGLKQIIYLGGLIDRSLELSAHLKSRLEVEKVLNSYGIPVTTLRAGLILGRGGSSFMMLYRLVQRLPMMLLPAWTATRTQAILIEDVIKLIQFCLLKEECFSQSYDVGTTEILTYKEMLRETALQLGKRRLFFSVPLFSPKLSKAWVSLVTGAPYSLVGPLVDSLRHEMLVRDTRLMEAAGLPLVKFRQALQVTLDEPKSESPFRRMRRIKKQNREGSLVRSVQRMSLSTTWTAKQVVDAYLDWLPRFLPWLLRVELNPEGGCSFYLSGTKLLLLKLALDSTWSNEDRQLLRIRGGILSRDNNGHGRLEFRLVLKGQSAIAAIHDYRPSLPWFIYNWTQARAHLFVMKNFGKYLKGVSHV
ncbi:MAG: NAD-dependent epimerase/dehydratase family protein [Bradymonadales bacterium]|nr:MAG: NAD-dependent epimerase/dehydratase family protein [Bradymonadales bacterium]